MKTLDKPPLLGTAGSGGRGLPTGGMGSVARRVPQLARRLNAAGRDSLRALSGVLVAAAAPPSPPPAQRGARGARVVASASAAAAAALAADGDQQLTLDLDWKAQLTFVQEVICWHTAGAVCCVAYALTAPAAVSITYGTCIGLLFGLTLTFMRSSMMEVLYKAKERFEADLGDPDSRFHTHDNLQVHVKVKSPPAAAGPPAAALHCYHGFGSNTWSWSLVQQRLAEGLDALVTAHDMPGFGLTQRPNDLSGYYLAFNGRLGRLVMDYELSGAGAMTPSEAARAEGDAYPHAHLHAADGAVSFGNGGPGTATFAGAAAGGVPAAPVGSAAGAAAAAKAAGLESGSAGDALAAAAAGDAATAAAAVKDAAAGAGASASAAGAPASGARGPARRVLVGHSLGGSCAALEAISHAADYAALVLVSPAILVGFGVGGGKETWLEQLHDDSALTRAHGGGAAAAAAAPSASDGESNSGGSDTDIAAAAEAAGGLAPRSSLGAAGSGSASPPGGGAAAPRGKSGGYTARAAGTEVAYYAARGTPDIPLAAPRGRGPIGAAFGAVANLLQTTMVMATVALILLLRPLVMLGLRAAVRSREFWKGTLQQAYYDKSKVTPEAVDAYRLPQLVRGWESGMVRFLLARLGARGLGRSEFGADAGTGRSPGGGMEDAGLATRLAAAVAKHKLPVLIVHGAGDKLVPVSNSLRLARMLPDARVAVLKRSGHCPQEELPDAFTHILTTFLESALAAPRAQAA
ncbi:hypothetical protein Rsub_00193 [Raphidocelis subcapitata]|uniref:AB hydrolase-1 domain-containing protein n=1 Tax=Raphidocelis subcapitata TaxID=307507 RepID=A0A2V0NM72_9CHLO|nr:hypothetical protein Rsub_00193 [Raphidocelis subcapitata]|eukprot:GBF87482.1 hypothetical protein Rsub_00193 [Raphidocelis subcapitata]